MSEQNQERRRVQDRVLLCQLQFRWTLLLRSFVQTRVCRGLTYHERTEFAVMTRARWNLLLLHWAESRCT